MLVSNDFNDNIMTNSNEDIITQNGIVIKDGDVIEFIYDSKEDLEIIKNLEMSKKQRKETDDAAKKAKEEDEKAIEEVSEEKPEEASEENATDESPYTESHKIRSR